MPKARTISFLLIALGWLTSADLMLPYISQDSGVPGCSGCGVLATTESAWQLGLPLAAWGLLYFSTLALLLFWGAKSAHRLALLVNALGAGASLVLLSHLLMGTVVWCGVCAVTHAINLTLLVSLWLPASSRSAREPVLGRFAGKAALAALSVAVLAGAGVETALFQAEVEPEEALARFETEPVQELARPQVATPEDGLAPVEISVFSCYQCPGCQGFALAAEQLSEQYGDRLHMTYYNFPLSTTCNPTLVYDMHPQACQAAWAAEAARLQGKFWEYHDALFHSDLILAEPTLQAVARGLGLDMDQWNADRNSATVRQKVSQDIQRGMELRIAVTPTVFLNGRKVEALGLPALTALIDRELSSAQ